MKKTKIFLIVNAICLTVISCNENNKPEEKPINIHDLISTNLLKKGTANHELLTCDWVCVKFAYTEDGNTIVDVEDISHGIVKIPDTENVWLYYYLNSHHFDCKLDANLIGLVYDENRESNIIDCPLPPTPEEESDILFVLSNAYSFVIIDKELIIYFTGIDDKNLMVLKNIEKDKSVWTCDEYKDGYFEDGFGNIAVEWKNFVLELTFYPSIDILHLKFINIKDLYINEISELIAFHLWELGISGYNIKADNKLCLEIRNHCDYYVIDTLSENEMIIKYIGFYKLDRINIRNFLFFRNTQ